MTPTPTRPIPKYTPAFDGLRGLAVLLVMAFHAYPRLVPSGWLGVDAFFVLSAYLITSLLRVEFAEYSRIDLARFYLRRSLRIVPALLAMLACYAAYARCWSTQPDQDSVALALAGTYLMNLARAFAWGFPGALGHTWSLAMEEQFYLLWPLVLVATGCRLRRRWLVGLLLVGLAWRLYLALDGATSERLYNGPDTHADGLLLGCCLAMTAGSARLERVARRFVLLPLAGLGLGALLPGAGGAVARALSCPAISFAAVWLLVAARQPGWFASLLRLPPLRFTGRISYGLYLWHYPILIIGSRYLPHGHISGLALLALGYGVAVVSFLALERPVLRLKDRWAAPRAPSRRPDWRDAPAGFELGEASTS